MAQFKLLSIPIEDYDALGITENAVIETQITDGGMLIIRPVFDDDLDQFTCDGDCEDCPIADSDCDNECLGCPCYACCDDSNFIKNERENYEQNYI